MSVIIYNTHDRDKEFNEVVELRAKLEDRLKELAYQNIILEERIEEVEQANSKIADYASELERNLEKGNCERNNLSHELHGDISRYIEFNESDYEYGLSILSHFGTIVEKKFPGKKIRVRIEQIGARIRMVILSGEEHLEIVERTLEEYGEVVKGTLSPEDFFSDPLDARLLRHKLENARMQLQQSREIFGLLEESNRARITSLENQLSQLNNFIAIGLTAIQSDREIISCFASRQADLTPEISCLLQKLSQNINENSNERIIEILIEIRDKNPSIIEKIETFIYGSIANTTGSFLYKCISSIK